MAGFEPTTSSSRTKRATGLRYTPRMRSNAHSNYVFRQSADSTSTKMAGSNTTKTADGNTTKMAGSNTTKTADGYTTFAYISSISTV